MGCCRNLSSGILHPLALFAAGTVISIALGCGPGPGATAGAGTQGGVTTGSGGGGWSGAGGAQETGGHGSSGSGGSSGMGPPDGTAGAGAAGRGGLAGASGTGKAGAGGAPGAGGVSGAPGTAGAGGTAGSVSLDPALLKDCAGTNPIRCAIPVAGNGDYTVTVALGDPAAASVARVEAELYRIVVPQQSIPAGPSWPQTFSVNVRAEVHDGYSAPGMILDVIIDAPAGGPPPRLAGLGVAAAPKIPAVFVAGDSTVCDWDPALATILDPSERGWAQELSQFLTPNVTVANYADAGETAGTFYTKFFSPARAAMRAGDYLFIQFGHNDQKSDADIAAYQGNLMKYITDARAKGATPVLFTPVARKAATAADPGFAGLDQQVRDLAANQNVALVDLTALSLAYYKTVPNLSALFATPTEGTHFGESGATQIASLVAAALKRSTLPLGAQVK